MQGWNFFTFVAAVAMGLAVMAAPASAAGGHDPLDSPMWEDMQKQFFGDDRFEFDDRVKVSVPSVVENQAQVPVTVDARGLGDVRKVVVFADLNPVQHTLTLIPNDAQPYIAFRMKVEQATPVRAAVLTGDGVWHVGGQFLEAAGGGCSSPAMARNKPDWSSTVGHTRGRAWRQADGMSKLRMTIKHPMDTGLTRDNIPAFYIEELRVRSKSGKVLATIKMHEPVSEDPTLTMLVRQPLGEKLIGVEGRDVGGNLFSSQIDTTWRESRLGSPKSVE